MAISARVSQLLGQRKTFRSYSKFQGGRKVLIGKVSSIANKIQQGEDEDIIRRYEDGLVSNEEFLSFLQSVINRPETSVSDRAQIEQTIRETRLKIGAEQLEANYDLQEDRTPAKAQAAQAIADYYKARAEELVPGTPAHSVAIQNMDKWADQASSIASAAETDKRKLLRYAKELEISAMEGEDSEKTMEKANMYYQLAQEAANDGEAEEALRLQRQGNDAVTRAQSQYETEGRKERRVELNTLKNAWHDGTISFADIGQALYTLNEQAINNMDDNLLNMIDNFWDTVVKDNEKGLKRATYSGLPVVTGRGKGSGSTSVLNTKTNMTWEEEDENYVNQMEETERMIKLGLIDPYTGTAIKTALMMERASVLAERSNQLSEVPYGSRINYQGDNKDAGDVYKVFVDELKYDARNPFGAEAKAPIPNEGLVDILEFSNPEMTSTIQAKMDELQQSGTDTTNMSVYDIVGSINQDFSAMSTKAYVQDIDEYGRVSVKIIDKDDENFIPGVTHVTDGSLWHKIEGGNIKMPDESTAISEFIRRYGREPEKGEITVSDDGTATISTPQLVRLVNADGSTDIWSRSEAGAEWTPQDPEMARMVQEIKAAGVIKPGTSGEETVIPTDPEKLSQSVFDKGTLQYYYPQVEKYKKLQGYEQVAKQAETQSRVSDIANKVVTSGVFGPLPQAVDYLTTSPEQRQQELRDRVGNIVGFIKPALKPEVATKFENLAQQTVGDIVAFPKYFQDQFIQPVISVARSAYEKVPEPITNVIGQQVEKMRQTPSFGLNYSFVPKPVAEKTQQFIQPVIEKFKTKVINPVVGKVKDWFSGFKLPSSRRA